MFLFCRCFVSQGAYEGAPGEHEVAALRAAIAPTMCFPLPSSPVQESW
jgi:hypothetical protein